jgi:hypothetical protein
MFLGLADLSKAFGTVCFKDGIRKLFHLDFSKTFPYLAQQLFIWSPTLRPDWCQEIPFKFGIRVGIAQVSTLWPMLFNLYIYRTFTRYFTTSKSSYFTSLPSSAKFSICWWHNLLHQLWCFIYQVSWTSLAFLSEGSKLTLNAKKTNARILKAHSHSHSMSGGSIWASLEC